MAHFCLWVRSFRPIVVHFVLVCLYLLPGFPMYQYNLSVFMLDDLKPANSWQQTSQDETGVIAALAMALIFRNNQFGAMR